MSLAAHIQHMEAEKQKLKSQVKRLCQVRIELTTLFQALLERILFKYYKQRLGGYRL